MSRSYDSSRRKQQADETRRRILDAAVSLHRRGVTAYEPLAELAGVALPTVRKHFPNREQLFEGCTAHFAAGFATPDFATAGALRDPGERLRRVAELACAMNEQVHDLVWHASPLCAESAALRAALAGITALVEAATGALVDGRGLGLRGAARDAARRRVRVLLDPLTYRTFRVSAGCDAAATRDGLTALLGCAVGMGNTRDDTP